MVIGIAAGIGAVYVCLLQFIPEFTVYASFGLFFIGAGLMGWGCLDQYNSIEKGAATNSYEGSGIWMFLAIFTWSLGILFFLVFLCGCSNMASAINLIKVKKN